jgi:hypothetical protein
MAAEASEEEAVLTLTVTPEIHRQVRGYLVEREVVVQLRAQAEAGEKDYDEADEADERNNEFAARILAAMLGGDHPWLGGL